MTLKPMYFQLPGALFRGPLVYLASDLNTNVLSPRDGLIQLPTLQFCSVRLWEGGWKDLQGWLLTDALEIGNGPVGHVHGLVEHTFGQAGCPGFTLEARVTCVPLPGAQVVTLDPDVCMFDRRGRRACDACRGADKTGQMNTFQLVQRCSPGQHGWHSVPL